MPITDKMWPHLLRLHPEIKAMECEAPNVVPEIEVVEITPEQIEATQIKEWLKEQGINFPARLGLVKLRLLKKENQ